MLVLGKDVGQALDRLKRIAAELEPLGYHTYIMKEQPDKAGESVIQKVLRHALSSKFVLIENTEPSGHLSAIPHVAKAAECVTVVLQEEGKGATWMFEDAYAKHRHSRTRLRTKRLISSKRSNVRLLGQGSSLASSRIYNRDLAMACKKVNRLDKNMRAERIRIDREREAIHDLILWLDEPAGI